MTVSINGIDQSVPSVEDYGRAVQDLTALKAIPPSERFDKQQVFVEDEVRPYYFDIDSASAESLPDIAEPNDAPASGRWIRLPPAGGGVPAAHGSTHTSIGIDAIPAAVPAGASGLFTGADKTKLDGIGALANVTSVFGRTGVVVATFGDYQHLDLSGIGTDDHHSESHGLGDAVHVPTSLAGLNAKVTDAVLDDVSGRRGVDETIALAGDWDTGAFNILTQGIRARSGQSLGFLSDDGGDKIVVADSGVTLLSKTSAVGAGVQITQIDGTDPVDNTTALDSRKLGFENRIWSGSAAVTRTVWIRSAGLANNNDISRLLFSNDQAGSESAFFAINFVSGASIQVLAPGRIMNFLGGSDNLTAMSIAASGRKVSFSGEIDLIDNNAIRLGTGDVSQLEYNASQTNNGLMWGMQGSEGNYLLFTDKARIASDFALAAQSNPTMFFHDGSVTLTNWGSITHDGTDFLLTANAGFIKLNADVQVVGDITPEGASGGRDAGATAAAFNTVFTRKVRPDGSTTLQFFTGGGVLAFEVANSGIMTFNQNGNAAFDVIFEGDVDPVLLSTDAGLDRVGVGVVMEAHAGKFHVRQPVTDAAIPVVVMEQLDIDDTFINFIGTSAADGTRSISSDTTEDSAKVGAVRVEFNGALAWMRLFATES